MIGAGINVGRWRDALFERLVDGVTRHVPLRRLPHANVTAAPLPDPDVVDIVTVAFENADVIGWQQELLARNLRDPYRHTVVDNSPTADARARIRAATQRYGTGYVDISVLTRRFAGGSMSHGIALNWAWYRLLRPRGAEFAAFLDHDVLPIAPTSLREEVGSAGVFGLVQPRPDRWYLWAGLSCFRRDVLVGRRVDFRPEPGVTDTGGRNWGPVFSRVDREALHVPPHRYGHLRPGDDPQSDYFEMIGDWLHVINASRWKPAAGRDELVAELVGRYLRD